MRQRHSPLFQCELLEKFLKKLADEMNKHPIWSGKHSVFDAAVVQ